MGIDLIRWIKERKFYNILFKALAITCIVAIIDSAGFAFLVLKAVSFIFVPNKNIDNMSDYYTVVWNSIKGNPTDSGRFFFIDITQNNRQDIAKILKRVNNMNPKIIGMDVSYIHEEDKNEDSLFVETVLSIPNIVLPVEYDSQTDSFLLDIFKENILRKKHGVVSILGNRDVIRFYRPSFHVGNTSMDAFGCVIAKECGADISTIQDNDKLLINYTTLSLSDEFARQGSKFLTHYSWEDSLKLANLVSNKIVIIGGFSSTEDNHLTPLGNMSGSMIHAHIINSLLENKTVTTTYPAIRYLLCFIIVFAVLVFYNRNGMSEIKEKNIYKTIVKYIFVFVLCVILISCIGTLVFYRLCYYIDFEPYIVALIIVYLLKDKNLNLRKICVH